MVVGVKEGANAHEVVKALITSMHAWRFIYFCLGPSFGVAFALCAQHGRDLGGASPPVS
jgi:hypothetical protein